MKAFAQLYGRLDASTSTLDKVAALVDYFRATPPEDAAWAVYFLSGGKPKQGVPMAELRSLACGLAGLSDWLFEESYQAVGDLAETIALVLPAPTQTDATGLGRWVTERMLPLRGLSAEERAERITAYWDCLSTTERFLLSKLMGGGFRVGVSKLLVQRALAQCAGVAASLVAERMMGYTDAKRLPVASDFVALTRMDKRASRQNDSRTDSERGSDAVVATRVRSDGQPYPFFLAHALDSGIDGPAALGNIADWQVEWKFDGIRAQVVKRGGQVHVWSRGEELISERFPEITNLATHWPDGSVLDGELLVWDSADPTKQPGSFAQLQPRITRKTLSKAVLAASPVAFMAYDLLEHAGQDLRSQPQWQRRGALEAFAAAQGMMLSQCVTASDWEALATLRQTSRERGVEGFMLKHRSSPYGVGRSKAKGGAWLKWKVDPMTADGVLVYAQAGHGRRASLYTDYTFAAWSRAPVDAAEAQAAIERIAAKLPAEPGALQLLPFAKAYSGLSDEEFKTVDSLIRKTTLDKFGPVRSVRPSLVVELGFEGIQASPRHKSGIALRFPRMLRLRFDKPAQQAVSLGELQDMI